MTQNSKVTNSQRNKQGRIRDLTISLIGAGDQRYAMFELVELSNEGAFLGGALLLEKGESFTLEITSPHAQVRPMRAQVVDVILGKDPVSGNPVSDNPSGVRIKWMDLSDADQQYLDAQLKDQK